MEITNIELTVKGKTVPPCLGCNIKHYAPEQLDMVTIIDYDEKGGFQFGLNIHTYITGTFGRDSRKWA